MDERVLGTLTIGRAPRPNVTPIVDRHVPAAVRRIDRGVLFAAVSPYRRRPVRSASCSGADRGR